ncbi:hypothetical protein FHW58_002895 [Duganella sp. 1224]|uniref:lysylphosphatidylglycerol synthase domain-containing protein n=1 Tax=Duganella sp. 1224 TaxID=2587052 RepID=UPI0015C82C14|nr:lysylphosphatidylglycerol synthase domain-containing protein [Duganella sp. 1224]NYE61688.1 hypothetical protein [Duganella sp. 1224]
MSRPSRIYLAVLAALLLAWLALQALTPDSLLRRGAPAPLLPVLLLYFSSHLFRLARLAMLSLDQRAHVPALLAAHGLTAFPSSLLPFKIGEILRLAAFLRVFDDRRKALAVWLAERCADVLVLAALMLALSLFQVQLPPATRTVFLVFLLVSVFGLLGLFTVARTFVYLNRHLVLNSSSARGLRLLRASHALRQLELALKRSLEGRLTGLLLLSALIWLLEISALALFLEHLAPSNSSFAALFANGLLNNLSASPPAASQYQSLVLAALAVLSLGALGLARRLHQGKS